MLSDIASYDLDTRTDLSVASIKAFLLRIALKQVWVL